ncbi:MAG TPA: hypothetical protein VLL06_09925 [Nitrospiraceae bacterium]|nr:hypothetical protein [Nitrospiraceae bacterium]
MKHFNVHDDHKKDILHDAFMLLIPPLLILICTLWLFDVIRDVAPFLVSLIDSSLARLR